LTETEIDRLIDSGDVLHDENFLPEVKDVFGQFYAPFDWINKDADIVLIGITPGKRQAKTALKTLRDALIKGQSPTEAAKLAKQAASFDGEMRNIAARLMNRFKLHKLFALEDCADLFGLARHRTHYTSILRYPVLHRQTKKKNGITAWYDYSGGKSISKVEILVRSIARDFEPEITHFKHAWLVPFGPIPALVLDNMVKRGIIDPDRILPGINHPTGTQHNRHNCQLNITEDHSRCASNVGCETIQGRSGKLEQIIAAHLSSE
jgi:hypothetical protein